MCDIFDQLHMRDIFILGGHRLCTKSVPPPQIVFSTCFKTVVGMFSEMKEQSMVFPTPFSSARHFFPPNSKTSFLNVYRFFFSFARQQESRLFFLHQGFLLSCTLYQLNKTMI